MLLRALAWIFGWLALALVVIDPTGVRVAITACVLALALTMRARVAHPPTYGAAAVAAGGLLLALVLTAASPAQAGRTVLGAMFGLLGVYCASRALRG